MDFATVWLKILTGGVRIQKFRKNLRTYFKNVSYGCFAAVSREGILQSSDKIEVIGLVKFVHAH